MLKKGTGFRNDLAPHKEALRILRDGGRMCDACKAHGVSRQTLRRMLKKEEWPKNPGGFREGRCKIPPKLVDELNTMIRLYKEDGSPIGASAVDWLKKRRIIVTPAAIYSLRYRKKAKSRKKRMAAKAPAKA